MRTFINMLRDESGAAAAEYALILAIVGGAIAIAAVNLGSAVKTSLDRATDCIKTPADTSKCTTVSATAPAAATT